MDPDNLQSSHKNANTSLKSTNSAPGAEDYENTDPQTAADSEMDEYIERVRGQFRYDLLAHDNYIQNFDSYEAMMISQPYDSVSKKVQNGLSDGATTTIYQERAARVCGQLPTGSVKAAGKKDTGASAVLDIILQKYVYPNANAQAPLLEKFRNWQFYSSVYGYMVMHYDWEVNENTGYIGPNCWLWHPRNFIPQIGRGSVDDMDYCNAITFQSEHFFKDLLKQTAEELLEAGWDRDELVIACGLIEERMRFPDSRRDSLVTRERQSQAEKGRIMVATRFEAGADGNWVTFLPEYNGVVVRSIRNPHKNGKIPFVVKYATPLFDNFYGLGDFQRAKPLQFFSDGLDNFYAAGLKRGLYPPTIINPAGVVKSSITQDPGAIWQETVTNSIREYQTSPVGLNTYQAAKTMVNGSLMRQAGTTDTTMTSADSGSPMASKTDSGVQQQQQKEGARDNQDRFYLESKIEVLFDRMIGLFGTIATEDIPLDLFVEDFEDIDAAGWGDDLKGMIDVSESGQSARMTIKPSFFKNLTLRFFIDANSTASADKRAQLQNLRDFIQSMGSMQNEMVDMKNAGMTIDWALVAKLEEQLSDVPEMRKIFRKMTPEEQQAYQQQQQQAGPQQKPPQVIDTAAFKDVPAWAQEQWLANQGYKQPQGATTDSTDTQIKQQELALKEKQVQIQATAANKQPAATPGSPEAPVVVHNGRKIKDPEIAKAHIGIGELLHGR
jgi:hypothetical protein